MAELEQLAAALDDLIGVLHTQAKEIENLITHIEQTSARLTYPTQMPLIVSELSELRQRVRRLCGS